MITTLLTLTAMLLFVLFPALIPAAVTAVHALRKWHPSGLRAIRSAVPAAA